jgi:hypothetical protein
MQALADCCGMLTLQPLKRIMRCLKNAPVAQLDRVSGYEPEGREFESLRARHIARVQRVSLFAVSNIRGRFQYYWSGLTISAFLL